MRICIDIYSLTLTLSSLGKSNKSLLFVFYMSLSHFHKFPCHHEVAKQRNWTYPTLFKQVSTGIVKLQWRNTNCGGSKTQLWHLVYQSNNNIKKNSNDVTFKVTYSHGVGGAVRGNTLTRCPKKDCITCCYSSCLDTNSFKPSSRDAGAESVLRPMPLLSTGLRYLA